MTYLSRTPSTLVAAERRKKFHQKNIDKGLQRGSRRSGIY